MITNKLLVGKLRGIEFRFREGARSGGRKTIFHTYPNSNTVLAEDLGRAPITIGLIIIVEGFGDIYYSRRDAIIKALESDGSSILSHPTYGELNVQIDGNYSIVERLSTLGYAEISVSFIVVDNKVFLEADTNTGSYINTTRDYINKSLEDTFMANLYTKAGTSYEAVESYTETVLTEAENIVSTAFETLNDYNTYKAQLTTLVTYYPSRISNLGANVSDIFKTVNNKVTNPLDEFNFYRNYFDFLDNVPTFNPTTRDLYYTQNNQNAYKTFVQGTALAYSMSAASGIDYFTDEQQENTINTIMDQFDKVIQYPFIDSTQDVIQIDTSRDLTSNFEASDPIDVYNSLQDQKVAFLQVMKDKELDVPRVTTVDIANESLTNLIYRYYGNLDNYVAIRDLNKLEETSLLTGTYKILTA